VVDRTGNGRDGASCRWADPRGFVGRPILVLATPSDFPRDAAWKDGADDPDGELHVTKECPEYKGAAGDHCTIKSSNIGAIRDGSRVVYATAAAEARWTATSSSSRDREHADGHVNLDLGAGTGTITFTGGIGSSPGSRRRQGLGRLERTVHWDGTYSLDPMPATVA